MVRRFVAEGLQSIGPGPGGSDGACRCVVVGAGVVGLAVARALAQAGRETIVVEAAADIGTGMSSRNSEVIHAGLYYAPGSLKARLCVRGKELLYDFCATHGVPHRALRQAGGGHRSGRSTRRCSALQQRAAANGVPAAVAERAPTRPALEPAVHCTAALLSPVTGIVDSHALMLALQGDLEARRRRAGAARPVHAGGCAPADRPWCRWRRRRRFEIATDLLVNAAGLHACALARRFDGLDARHVPRERYAKGSYFTLAGRSPSRAWSTRRPGMPGWACTSRSTSAARPASAPTWMAGRRHTEAIDYAVDPRRAEASRMPSAATGRACPTGALRPDYSGVRPKIHGPGEAAPDFRIDGPARHGVAGLVNLFGIESPGLTSCLAIGEWVAGPFSRRRRPPRPA